MPYCIQSRTFAIVQLYPPFPSAGHSSIFIFLLVFVILDVVGGGVIIVCGDFVGGHRSDICDLGLRLRRRRAVMPALSDLSNVNASAAVAAAFPPEILYNYAAHSENKVVP